MNLYLLGPKYTFSDALARKLPLPECTFSYVPSIPAIFDKLQNDQDAAALVPIENLLNGPVTSTLDGLTRLANVSRNYQIIHTDNLEIELFLGRPKKETFDPHDAEEIYSHEQAIGQSEVFLSLNGYKAVTIPSESTAVAVELCAKSKNKALAIASKEALEINDFQIISKTTGDTQTNQTRFALIASDSNKDVFLKALHNAASSFATSICLDPKMDRQGLLLEIINIISNTYECNLLSINSRPDHAGGFIFYLEIEGNINDIKISSCIQALREYCRVETHDSAALHVLGSYARKEFVQNTLKEITIIGSEGAMGVWLSHFFEDKGVRVLQIPKNASQLDKEKIKLSKYIFFSVPVQSLEDVIIEYLPYISEGSLLIDNSSVKVATAQLFKKHLPKNCYFTSIHTMFGPKEVNLKGKNVIFIDGLEKSELQNNLERFFYKYGALISKINAEEHDRLVGVTQSLVHFISFSFSKLLENEGLNKSTLNPFLTPNTLRLFENMSRTLEQSEELNELIMCQNSYSEKLRNELIQALKEVDTEINNDNLKNLHKRLKTNSQH